MGRYANAQGDPTESSLDRGAVESSGSHAGGDGTGLSPDVSKSFQGTLPWLDIQASLATGIPIVRGDLQKFCYEILESRNGAV
jgi:hypothetical protein